MTSPSVLGLITLKHVSWEISGWSDLRGVELRGARVALYPDNEDEKEKEDGEEQH